MQLKEFSLISPAIESTDVFKAIGTAIPLEVIEQTIGTTEAREERVSQVAISTGDLFGNCHELMVVGFDDNSSEKPCQWIE
jgi:hypothetical protein